MFKSGLAILSVIVVAFWFDPAFAFAQNIGISTPFNTINDSFYENTGVSWGFQMGSGTQSQVFGSFGNSSTSAIPPFGGYDPNADATFGFINRNPNGDGFSLGLRMGKGSSRTMASATPSLVVPNGGTGAIFDGSLRPFVTGIIPVVADNHYMGNPNWEIIGPAGSGYTQPPAQWKDVSEVFDLGADDSSAQPASYQPTAPRQSNSSAQQGDLSVAEIKRQRGNKLRSENLELQKLIEEAERFEQAGDIPRARIRYKKALKNATGQLRYELKLKTEELKNR